MAKTENRSSQLIKEYMTCKLHFPVSPDTKYIDERLKELSKISEEKKVTRLIANIDYQIQAYFNKIGFII